ncbi:MAG: hypothetical protein ABJG47_09555 [Ekhidna sp.]
MSVFSKLFSKKELVEEAGVCPNCWGEQAYDDKFIDKAREKQIDVNNHEGRHAFIQDFVVNHVDGIHLHKEDNGIGCPRCHRKIT